MIDNSNFLRAAAFSLTISGQDFQGVEFACAAAQIPSRVVGEVMLRFRGGQTFESGDEVQMLQLPIEFYVSKDLSNYLALDSWLMRNAVAAQTEFRDLTLTILSPQNNPIKTVRFIGALPMNLGALNFDVRTQESPPVSVPAVFRYTRHEFI